MATYKGTLAQQTFNDVLGIVLGLYNDPADTVSLSEKAEIFTGINYTELNVNAMDRADYIIWSRLLLVELIVPYDTSNYASKLALVLKPRSLWLFEKGANISDYIGNAADPDDMCSSSNTTIVEINPPYRKGDVIRCASLPAPVDITNFDDHYSRTESETFDGSTSRTASITGGISNFRIVGSSVTGKGGKTYSDLSVSQVLFYDKNIDARTRIVGSGSTESSDEVTVALCIGGVTKVYKLKGTLA